RQLVAATPITVVVLGCRQRPAPATPAAAPAARTVPKLLVYAGGPIQVTAQPPELVPQPPPSVGDPSLGAACDAVQRVLADRLKVEVKRPDSTSFDNEFEGGRRTGCELTASGTFKAMPDVEPGKSVDDGLSDALTALGWGPLTHYSADGPDGSAQAMRSRETVCIFRWSWDGGDDSDSTYVPSDAWDEVTHCAAESGADTL